MKVAIHGAGGSIGKRHLLNILQLGHDVIAIENDINKHEELSKICKVYSSKEEVPTNLYDIVFICTQTNLHINDAIFFANKNKHIFVEKPLSHDDTNVSVLVDICKKNSLKLMVSENLRFNRGIELVKILLDNSSIGKVFASNYFFGSWLPDWRPTTDYRLNYGSQINGGVLRDDVHAIALSIHLFGLVNKSTGILHNTHTLEIVEDDIADYILQHDNGIISHIHSNYLLPFYCRTLEIYGLEGSIQFDYVDQIVNIRTKSLDTWRTFDCSCDTNDMYLKQLQYYISCIENNIEPYYNGIEAMEIVTQLKEQNK